MKVVEWGGEHKVALRTGELNQLNTNVRTMARARRLSLRALERKVGWPEQTIYKVLGGNVRPAVKEMKDLARGLGIPTRDWTTLVQKPQIAPLETTALIRKRKPAPGQPQVTLDPLERLVGVLERIEGKLDGFIARVSPSRGTPP